MTSESLRVGAFVLCFEFDVKNASDVLTRAQQNTENYFSPMESRANSAIASAISFISFSSTKKGNKGNEGKIGNAKIRGIRENASAK